MEGPAHLPVMAERAADWLVTDPRGLYWDATVGAAGHARKVAERLTEGGKLFCSDRDPRALAIAAAALTEAPVTFVAARFSELVAEWRRLRVMNLNGLLFDFGMGSFQLDDASRGMSFDQDGPLDMRMGRAAEPVRTWLNVATEADLAEVITRFGEERRARAIARAIVRHRPLETTSELRAAIVSVTPARAHTKTLARVFQALRIRVNDELEEIRQGLEGLREMLAPGGRVVTIAYHSLEDRLVKHFFRRESRDCVCPPSFPQCVCEHKAWLKVLTPRAEVPGPEEEESNPRARSARLRVAERIA